MAEVRPDLDRNRDGFATAGFATARVQSVPKRERLEVAKRHKSAHVLGKPRDLFHSGTHRAAGQTHHGHSHKPTQPPRLKRNQ